MDSPPPCIERRPLWGLNETAHPRSQGQAVIDSKLYMWLNFVTTAACGVGALATIKVEVRAPGLLCVLQSAW